MKRIIDIPQGMIDAFSHEEQWTEEQWTSVLCRDMNTVLQRSTSYEERLRGEWIVTKQDFEGIHEIKCPFCEYAKGSEFNPYIKVTFDKFPPFCENCGADLREKEK